MNVQRWVPVFITISSAMLVLATFKSTKALSSIKIEASKVMLKDLEENVVRFHRACGAWPISLADLFEGRCPYFASTKWKKEPLDPWGHRFEFQLGRDRIDILSLGADGNQGGIGDESDIAVVIPTGK
jgi:hypothetical protein